MTAARSPSTVVEPKGTPPPWDRLPSEPARWYARFETYRLLGPTRTLAAAHKKLTPNTESVPGHAWFAMARLYRWTERADAWDTQVRDTLRAKEEQRRFDARETRLTMIDALLTQTYTLLQAAKVDNLTPETITAILPTLRAFFRDLLAAQRVEFEATNPAANANPTSVTIEDLRAAYDELKTWQEQQPPTRSADTDRPATRSHFYYTLSTALAELYPDFTSLQRLADAAGVPHHHLRHTGRPDDSWFDLLREADRHGRLLDLLSVVRAEYPTYPPLLEAMR